jgi:pimeloyl-ACP methyl ester carboxylesterase
MRVLSLFLACALAGGAVAGVTSAARADGPDAEAVTIGNNNPKFTVYTPPVRLDKKPHNARASVILMTGGNGLLSLDSTGTIIDSTGNFLIRSADLFLREGLNVMMADTAPAHPNGIDLTFRLSPTHATETQGFINAAISRWGKPVWVVGTSNGSVSAVTAAGILPALSGLAGVVLTSTVTDFSTSSDPINNPMIFNQYVLRITVPTFVVWHQNDQCMFSRPAGSQTLFNITPANIKDTAVFQGGHSVATDPCGAFSEHGYAGIEDDVVKNIAHFIK